MEDHPLDEGQPLTPQDLDEVLVGLGDFDAGEDGLPEDDPVRSLLSQIARLGQQDLERVRGAVIGEALEGMKVPPAERVAVAIMTVPELRTVNICTLAAHQISDGGLTHALVSEILPRYIERSVQNGTQVSLADFALYVVARASDEFAALPVGLRAAF